jgi:hypothetical protein
VYHTLCLRQCPTCIQGGRILGPEVLVNTAAMRSLQGLTLTPKNLAALKTMFQLVSKRVLLGWIVHRHADWDAAVPIILTFAAANTIGHYHAHASALRLKHALECTVTALGRGDEQTDSGSILFVLATADPQAGQLAGAGVAVHPGRGVLPGQGPVLRVHHHCTTAQCRGEVLADCCS